MKNWNEFTVREQQLIKEAVTAYAYENARVSMGTKKSGTPLYLREDIAKVNELNRLGEKLRAKPNAFLVVNNDRTENSNSKNPAA